MSKQIQRKIVPVDNRGNVSVSVETINIIELPKFGEDKKALKCSPETTVGKIIEYIHN